METHPHDQNSTKVILAAGQTIYQGQMGTFVVFGTSNNYRDRINSYTLF
jgi:hypothetical protein